MLTIKQFTYDDEVKYILQVGKNKILIPEENVNYLKIDAEEMDDDNICPRKVDKELSLKVDFVEFFEPTEEDLLESYAINKL